LSVVLSEVSDAVALEEAAMAVAVEDATVDVTSLETISLEAPRRSAGSRDGDVVAAA
jgi:hypothetical protein